MTRCQYLDLADYLAIAERVLEIDAGVLAKMTDFALADSALNAPAAQFGDVEFYPDFATKAAVLCVRLCKNHALPNGNKRVAYMCMVEFIERNGRLLLMLDDDKAEDVVQLITAVAAGEADESTVQSWVAARLREETE